MMSPTYKIIAWFKVNNPFDVCKQWLRSLSSGVSATDADTVN